jgi:heme/copper-type cytochrome/quinol oxidase subunit 3
MTTGLVFSMHRIYYGNIILLGGFLLILYIARQWFYNVEDEATLFGHHTLVVKHGLYSGFILFLVSEFMLFFGFFWAFFHSAFSPSIVFALLWPFDKAFISINCLGLPGYNTLLLIFSGLTVTYAHVSIASSSHSNTLDALYMTISLGILFLVSQINEYYEIAYNLNDSVYSSVFFMLTGLHGFHVFAGVFFFVCLFE